MASSLLAGLCFGTALTAAGVYSPTVILSQLSLENYHMLQTFITASATSAVAIYSIRNRPAARQPSSLGLFPYDGNVIGGLLLGAGMALTGACPGTVLPQLALRVPSAPWVLLGGVLAGTFWAVFGARIKAPGPVDEKPTVHQRLGCSKGMGVMGYVVLCTAVLAVTGFAPVRSKGAVSPVVGGLLVGLSQLSSLLLTGSTLGVSIAYERIGRVFLSPFSSSSKQTGQSNDSLFFVVGTTLGALLLSKFTALPVIPGVEIGAGRALLGGVIMVLGGRVGGGCTSGHGISGMALGSVSSFVSVAAMFGGGIVLSALL